MKKTDPLLAACDMLEAAFPGHLHQFCFWYEGKKICMGLQGLHIVWRGTSFVRIAKQAIKEITACNLWS